MTHACASDQPRKQRGAAALVVTMLLFFAMVLVAFFVNRNLVFEQRSSANQYRSTQAFEAAEAGLEWALAQLNNPQRIDADCRPSTDVAATSFRMRYLSVTRASATFAPVTWNAAGVATALQPTCVRSAGGWSCSCPSNSLPALGAAAAAVPAAAFTLRFMPNDKPGVVQLSATGCTSLAGECLPGSATSSDATAKVNVALGLLAGLRTPPAATLTTRGAFMADAATLGVHNPDPATGVAIDAGGVVAAAHARLTSPAGAAGALVSQDTPLAALSADRFFASHFGLDKAAWKNQPAVIRIRCGGADCSAELSAAVGSAADSALIWVEGDLTLTGPLTLGSLQHPIVVIASGAARLNGAVALTGVLYGASISWNDTSGGARLRGAALSETRYEGNGAPELFYDTAVLAALKNNSGSFARVSGSWRDF